jgi:hypothetical protein
MAISSTDRRAKNVQIFVEKTQSKLVLKNGHNQVIFLELWLKVRKQLLGFELTRMLMTSIVKLAL